MNSFVALDLETTGLSPVRDEILEVGAVRIENGKMTQEMQALVKIGRPLSQFLIHFTGITQEDLLSARPAEEVLEELYEFLGDEILLGHNLLFDYSFLKTYYQGKGKSFLRQGVDTLEIARKKYPDLPSRSLEELSKEFQLPGDIFHRALEDAKTAARLYFVIGGEEDSPKALEYRVPKQSPITLPQKKYLKELVEYRRINLIALMRPLGKEKIEELSRREASRLIDGILSHRE